MTHVTRLSSRHTWQDKRRIRRLAVPGTGNLAVQLRNVWWIVSCEDQQWTDKRVSDLILADVAHKGVSLAPLLGPIDLRPGNWIPPIGGGPRINPTRPWEAPGPAIEWAAIEGEAGPGSRPCGQADIRRIVKQLGDAGVACFVKQLGSYSCASFQDFKPIRLKHPHGADPSEWPPELVSRELPWTLRKP